VEVKPAEAEKVVQMDDPLPAGSTLRFGTSRFRHGVPVSMMAVSADGKLAVAVNGNHVLGSTRVFDLASGRALYSLDHSAGWIEAAAISPDVKATGAGRRPRESQTTRHPGWRGFMPSELLGLTLSP
jgi:hypothetical protein